MSIHLSRLLHVNCKLIENITIEIKTSRNKIQFLSCYLPGGTQYPAIQQHYRNDIRLLTNTRSKYYALGDLNLKDRFWHRSSNNTAGTILYKEFISNNFDIIYPDKHTHHPFDTNRSSSTVVIGIINCDFDMSALTQHHFRSDHNGIMSDINVAHNTNMLTGGCTKVKSTVLTGGCTTVKSTVL